MTHHNLRIRIAALLHYHGEDEWFRDVLEMDARSTESAWVQVLRARIVAYLQTHERMTLKEIATAFGWRSHATAHRYARLSATLRYSPPSPDDLAGSTRPTSRRSSA